MTRLQCGSRTLVIKWRMPSSSSITRIEALFKLDVFKLEVRSDVFTVYRFIPI